MVKNSILLAGAALAASSLQAFASPPQATSPTAPDAPAFVAGRTGLTAADLIVGRDGRVAVDVRARAVRVASCNNTSCQDCNSGSC